MKIRTIAAATGLCLVVLTGCGNSVAGQAQIAAGVVPTTSKSAPSPFPDPSSGSTGTSSDTSTSSETTGQGTDDSQVTENTPTQESSTTESADSSDGASSTGSDDSSVGPTSATSIPGLSKDCNTVLAAITAFSGVLQGAGTAEKISQETVDTALDQLPASGLPARPLADVAVLRETVAGAAGKSLIELGRTMADGKVVAALKDLSRWSQDNCT